MPDQLNTIRLISRIRDLERRQSGVQIRAIDEALIELVEDKQKKIDEVSETEAAFKDFTITQFNPAMNVVFKIYLEKLNEEQDAVETQIAQNTEQREIEEAHWSELHAEISGLERLADKTLEAKRKTILKKEDEQRDDLRISLGSRS